MLPLYHRTWQSLGTSTARRKLGEVEALFARATTMKSILEVGIRCECLGPVEFFLLLPAGE
jgi:hypothetical protein